MRREGERGEQMIGLLCRAADERGQTRILSVPRPQKCEQDLEDVKTEAQSQAGFLEVIIETHDLNANYFTISLTLSDAIREHHMFSLTLLSPLPPPILLLAPLMAVHTLYSMLLPHPHLPTPIHHPPACSPRTSGFWPNG